MVGPRILVRVLVCKVPIANMICHFAQLEKSGTPYKVYLRHYAEWWLDLDEGHVLARLHQPHPSPHSKPDGLTFKP